MAFFFLGLGYFTELGIFQSNLFSCKFHRFIFLKCRIKSHCLYIPHFHYPVFSWRMSSLVPFPKSSHQREHPWIWMSRYLCCGIESSLGVFPGAVYLNHMEGLFLHFWEASRLISIVAATSLHSHQWYNKFPLATSLPALGDIYSLDGGCSDWSEMESHHLKVVLICIPLTDNDFEHL